MAKRKVLYEGDIQILPMTHVDCVMGDEGKTLNGLLAEKANAAQLNDYLTISGFNTTIANYATNDALATERERAKGEEKAIREEYKAADSLLQNAINGKVDQSAYDAKVEAIEKSITDEVARATKAEEAAQEVAEGAAQLAANNKTAIDKLNGPATEDGSVAKAVKDAQTTLQAGIDAAEDRITVVEEKIGSKLDEITEVASKQALDAVEKAVEDLQAEDLRLGGLIEAAQGDADAALDAIGDANKGLVKEIADLKAKDEDLQDAIDGKVAQADYNSKVTELEAAHTTLSGQITGEASRADAAEKALGLRIDANKNAIDAINSEENGILAKAKAHANTIDTNVRAAFAAADQGLQQEIDDVEAAVAAINNEETGILAQAKADAKAKDDAVRAAFKTQDDLLAGRIAALETFKDQTQPAKDQLQDEKIAALEKLHEENGTVDQKIKAVQDDVDAVEGRMTTAEGAISAINNEETGILAQGKKYADDQDAVLKEELEGTIGDLEDRVAANETFVAAQPAIDAEQDRRLGLLEGLVVGGEGEGLEKVIADVAAAQTAAQNAQAAADKAQEEVDALEGVVDKEKQDRAAADTALGGRIDALAGDVTSLDADLAKEVQDRKDAINGLKSELQAEIDTDVKVVADALADEKDANKEGSLAKKIADEAARAAGQEAAIRSEFAAVDEGLQSAIDALEAAVGNDGLEGRVKANEDKLAGLKVATVQGAIDAAENNAKAHAESKIAELVDSAPEAMNTLNELAEAIKAHGTEYEAYVATVTKDIGDAKQAAIEAAAADAAAKDAALQTSISAEIDADVKVEKERAVAEENKIRGEFANADAGLQQAIDAINNETTGILAKAKAYADAEDAKVESAFAAADATLKSELQDEIDADVKVVADALADEKNANKAGSLAHQIASINTSITNGLHAVDVPGDKVYADITL